MSSPPILSIRAMATMGPWLLDRIDVLPTRAERCQRCSTRIRYVWVMVMQAAPRQTWRIGSECGPNLEDMSKEIWAAVAKPYAASVRYVPKLEKLARLEREHPNLRPADYELGWAERLTVRLASKLDPHHRRVLNSNINRAYNLYREAILRSRRPSSRRPG
jgi:hypothetical protein